MAILIAGSTPADEFELKSQRFNDNDSAYFSRTQVDGGNRKTWTWSCWAKRCAVGTLDIFGTPSEGDGLRWYGAANNLNFLLNGSSGGWLVTNRRFRDPAAWYHIVFAFDTTQATAANRMKLYINGVQETSFSAATYPSQNSEFKINQNGQVFSIGKGHGNNYLDGYLAEVYFADGSALDASYFGETNVLTNQWQPIEPSKIKPTVTFGTNGFYLPFSNDALATSFISRTGPYTTATFTTVESTTWTAPAGITSVDYLVVAGGGGGGPEGGGGGGGGGMRTGVLSVTPETSYTVTVGAGGAGSTSGFATIGGNSVFSSITSNGGAKGSYPAGNGQTGGTGGGAGYGGNAGQGNYPSTSPSQGGGGGAGGPYGGGAANSHSGGGGGGGGESGTNGAAGTNSAGSGNGGNGTAFSISGSSITYAGGGGGGTIHPFHSGLGGNGGGGAGGSLTGGPGTAGTDSLGGGGGAAAGTGSARSGGSGGDGIVIIRYFDSSGTLTNSLYPITANGNTTNTRVSNHKLRPDRAAIIGPKIGSSAIAFDGDEDFLSIPDSADWNFGTGDFTIDFWANTGAQAWEDDAFLWTQWNASTDYAGMRIRTNGWVNLLVKVSDSYTINLDFSSVTMPTNKWFHFALVRNTSGTNRFEIYIDGVLIQTINNSTAWPDIAGAFTIGDDLFSAGKEFTGYMDEFRVSKGVARWTADFNLTTAAYTADSNTKLLIHSNTTHGSTTFTDSATSGTTHSITASGNVKHVAPKIGTGMAAFDGTTSQLETAAAPTDWAFGTDDFTIDLWAYSDGWTNNECFNEAYAASNDYWEFRIKTNGDLAVSSYVGGSHVVDLDFDSANMPTGAWVHIELSRTGSTWRCFINGTETGDSQTSSGSMGTAGRQIKIGRNGRLNTFFKGYMDEFRISKIVRHTSNFTPSTTAYIDDKDTMMLLHMDGGGPGAQGSSMNMYYWDASTNAIFYDSAGVPTNKSIISFDGSGDYLYVAGSDLNLSSGSWTVEGWFRTNDVSASDYNQALFAASSDNYWGLMFNYDHVNTRGKLGMWMGNGSSWGIADTIGGSSTLAADRWYHVAMVFNGSTYKVYLDGVQDISVTSGTSVGSIGTINIGAWGNDSLNLAGYMDEIRLSDSARYSGTFTPSTTPFTPDVNTKLLIQSEFSEGGIGADHSGNYNYFAPTNLVADDMMLDSPMNNFCTFNPLNGKAALTAVLKEGNLRVGAGASASGYNLFSTFAVSSGKWYYEWRDTSPATRNTGVGWCDVEMTINGSGSGALDVVGAIWYNDVMYLNGSNPAIGATMDYGVIAGVAIDADAGKVWFSHTGVWWDSQNPAAGSNAKFTAGTNPRIWMPIYHAGNQGEGTVNYGQDSSFAGVVTAQGNQDENDKGDFYYAVPSGFLALCTDNLPDPSIDLPGDHFNTLLWTGDNTNNRAITGVGFQPDLVWIKRRTAATGNNHLYGVLPGVGSNGQILRISSNTTSQQADTTDEMDSLDSDGFTIDSGGGDNASGGTYVAWNWKGGNAISGTGDFTQGTIASTCSRNVTAGFSIVSYTGSGSTGTVGHGLSVAPDMVIVKKLSGTAQWPVAVIQDPMNFTDYIALDKSNNSGDYNYWNDTPPTASVFSLSGDGDVNQSTGKFIAYCFHSVVDYSRVGSWKATNSDPGEFFYCGFRPAWVLVKNMDRANSHWWIMDNKRSTYNIDAKVLFPDADQVEASGRSECDFVSNGVKFIGVVNPESNYSADRYLIYAIAESPFKTSNAR